MRYRKRPITVDAVRWDVQLVRPAWLEEEFKEGAAVLLDSGGVRIWVGRNPVFAAVGDWLVRNVHGQVYAVKDSVFKLTYEEVADDPDA